MSPGEREHATSLVNAILGTGCSISVWEGEDWALQKGKEPEAVLAAMASTDMDRLVATSGDGSRMGSFLLIYGNAPDELVADHSDNIYCNAIWHMLEPVRARLAGES